MKLRGGEFSTGTTGIFQPELTREKTAFSQLRHALPLRPLRPQIPAPPPHPPTPFRASRFQFRQKAGAQRPPLAAPFPRAFCSS